MSDETNTLAAPIEGQKEDTTLVKVIVPEHLSEQDDVYDKLRNELMAGAEAAFGDSEIQERALNAFFLTQMAAQALGPDQFEQQQFMLDKIRSTSAAVSGSFLNEVADLVDAEALLQNAYDWRVEDASLPEGETLLTATIPDDLRGKAFAGLATIGELIKYFGPEKTKSEADTGIKLCHGFKKRNKTFFATSLRLPTNVLSVRLIDDGKQETMVRWFVGRDRCLFPPLTNEESNIVRCGVKYDAQKSKQRHVGNHHFQRR